jgi:hypothetical protein
MKRQEILTKIKETESNINNWYQEPTETKQESDLLLRQEKRYLIKLKSKLGEYKNERIENLVDSIECF